MASEQWTRLREDVDCGLRRGAWYKVLFAGHDLVAVNVERERLLISRDVLEFVEKRPALWTVVLHTRESVSFPPSRGKRFAVCPNCRSRQVPIGRPSSLRCQRCNGLFEVDWHAPMVVCGTRRETNAIAS
jgi:hypothetical protein